MRVIWRDRIQSACTVCGRLYHYEHARLGKSTCSWKCKMILLRRGNDKGASMTCFNCGTIKRVNPSRMRECCSKKCMGEYRRGDRNPAWIDGRSYVPYPFEFKVVRKQLVERDIFTCRHCGEKENGKRLHVHHIDHNKQNNRMENLMALCETCHGKYFKEVFV